MQIVNGIQAANIQTFNVPWEDDAIFFSLRFLPSVRYFTIDISFREFSVVGLRVVAGPNILHQYRRLIPFGLLVEATDGATDPFIINDFVVGRVYMAILTESEVSDLETGYAEG